MAVLSITGILFVTGVNSLFAGERPDWDNPAVIQVNTEAPRATFIPFSDKADALAQIDDPKRSSRYMTLSGD
jgi:hypothetical protein